MGPVNADDVGEALGAVRKFGAAFQENLTIENRLARLGTDQRDGNAMARRAVGLNATVIALGARIAAIVVATGLAGSNLWVDGRRGL